MADRFTVVPEDLRQAARVHRDTAEHLQTVPRTHPDILAALESLGPIFADLRDAGSELLEQRRHCYEQQAAAHAELADKLHDAAEVWEHQDADAARRLSAPVEGGP